MTTAQATTRGQSSILAKIVTRFAPSPTGQLHLGHALSAVIAHDRARQHPEGRFIVRIEDIDTGRCRAEFVDAIFADLAWLGLTWDDVVIQSSRTDAYAEALASLHRMGLAYRCSCTRAEIAASATAPQGDALPVYPGTCRNRDIGETTPAAWRLDIAKAIAVAGPLTWTDAGAGTVTTEPLPEGDIVIARKDALASYHLAVTVDDAAQAITDVVRGRDLFAATHVHRLLQALLGLPTPRYHHHPLVLGDNGKRLAKRDGAATLAQLRAEGMDGAALAEMLRAGQLPIGFRLDAS
ncbi:MAG: tRNA glutamyl-Q(34) synthetase GluQRS [Sphingomonadaceae bacterium]